MPKLKWLVCDVTLDQSRPIEAGNAFKRRVIYWHDPARLSFMRACIVSVHRATRRARQRRVAATRAHALMKVTNVGEGVEALREGTLARRAAQGARSAAVPRLGVDARKRKLTGRRALPRRRTRAHEQPRADARRREREQNSARSRASNAMMRDWRDRIRAHHVEPIFVISPVADLCRASRPRSRATSRCACSTSTIPSATRSCTIPSMHYDRSHTALRRRADLLARCWPTAFGERRLDAAEPQNREARSTRARCCSPTRSSCVFFAVCFAVRWLLPELPRAEVLPAALQRRVLRRVGLALPVPDGRLHPVQPRGRAARIARDAEHEPRDARWLLAVRGRQPRRPRLLQVLQLLRHRGRVAAHLARPATSSRRRSRSCCRSASASSRSRR